MCNSHIRIRFILVILDPIYIVILDPSTHLPNIIHIKDTIHPVVLFHLIWNDPYAFFHKD